MRDGFPSIVAIAAMIIAMLTARPLLGNFEQAFKRLGVEAHGSDHPSNDPHPSAN